MYTPMESYGPSTGLDLGKLLRTPLFSGSGSSLRAQIVRRNAGQRSIAGR